MPHEPTWKYVEKTGPDKPMKTIVDVYDSHYGEYEQDAGVNYISSPKPSKQTKSPFTVSGGK